MKTASVLVLALCFVCVGCVAAGDDASDCAAPTTFYPDVDGDGYGDSAKGEPHCVAPAAFVARGGDCQDDAAAIHPEASEVCDAVDNDCDGMIDDADSSLDSTTATTFYRDADGDGFGTASAGMRACAKPAGYATTATDCNDGAPAVNPGAVEVCDQLDNDCDMLVDMADTSIDPSSTKRFYRDADADGFGAGTGTVACVAPSGYVLANGDCNDVDNSSYPGGMEICDGADNDCDGGIDGTVAQPNRCAALVGTYSGSYSHLAQEKIGTTVVNSMSCSGTGSASLLLNRKPGLQGSFTCVYSGGLTLFSQNQRVTVSASVGLNGSVTGTVDHVYNTFDNLHRVYNVTGTQTATSLSLSGTGSFYPNPMATVPWQVTFSFSTSR